MEVKGEAESSINLRILHSSRASQAAACSSADAVLESCAPEQEELPCRDLAAASFSSAH